MDVFVDVDESRFDEVVAAAEAAGLEVNDYSNKANPLTGRVSPENLAAVKAVDGVLEVTKSPTLGFK